MRDKYPTLIVIAYVVSRIMLYSMGIRFDGYSDTHIMQLPPLELLRSYPIETLWYMHMQPPLYSLLLCVFGQSPVVFEMFYYLLGIAVSIALYKLIQGFGKGNGIAFIASIAFMLSPSFILFENLMLYTFMVLAMLVFSALALQRKKILVFSVLLMVLCLTRSIFHPVWMGVSLWLATTKRFG